MKGRRSSALACVALFLKATGKRKKEKKQQQQKERQTQLSLSLSLSASLSPLSLSLLFHCCCLSRRLLSEKTTEKNFAKGMSSAGPVLISQVSVLNIVQPAVLQKVLVSLLRLDGRFFSSSRLRLDPLGLLTRESKVACAVSGHAPQSISCGLCIC